jgi:hypothetical protein
MSTREIVVRSLLERISVFQVLGENKLDVPK